FTVAAVWAGLTAAGRFADAFGEAKLADKYRRAASEIREATERVMFDQKLRRFARMVNVSREGEITADMTIDTSISGLWVFGMFDVDDPKIASTMEQIIGRLSVKTPIGGMARYENDYYHQVSKDVQNVAGNPWILCTLNNAVWYARRARSAADLQE